MKYETKFLSKANVGQIAMRSAKVHVSSTILILLFLTVITEVVVSVKRWDSLYKNTHTLKSSLNIARKDKEKLALGFKESQGEISQLQEALDKLSQEKGALTSDIVNTLTRRKDHAFGSSGVTDCYLEIQDSLVQGITEGVIKIESVNLDDILISLVKGA